MDWRVGEREGVLTGNGAESNSEERGHGRPLSPRSRGHVVRNGEGLGNLRMMSLVQIVGETSQSFRVLVVDRHVIEHGGGEIRELELVIPLNFFGPEGCNHFQESEESTHGLVQGMLED